MSQDGQDGLRRLPTWSGRTRSMPPTKPSRRPWPAPGHVAAKPPSPWLCSPSHSSSPSGGRGPTTRSPDGTSPIAGPSAGATLSARWRWRRRTAEDHRQRLQLHDQGRPGGRAAKEFSARGFWSARSPTTRRRSRSPAPRRCASGPSVLPTGPRPQDRRSGCDASPGRAPGAQSTSPSGKASPRWASCPSGPGRCVPPRRPHRVREHPQAAPVRLEPTCLTSTAGRGRGPRVSRSLAGQRRPGRCRW